MRIRSTVGRKQECISKTRIRSIDCTVPDRPGIHVRFALKKEMPVPVPCEHIKPVLVRVCQRWSFHYDNAYTYDFTKVATGTSNIAACDSVPTYELEIEVIPSSTYLSMRTDTTIARSLCAKVLDLCGRYRHGTNNTVVEDSLVLQLDKITA
jgi:hypothetical protein